MFLVGFIAEPLSKDAARTLLALAAGTEEELHTKGSEIFWLCKNGQSVSPLFRVPIEKRIGTLITWRNMNTIERIPRQILCALSDTRGPREP